MSDWQNISTAPKDGAVLIWVPENRCVYAAYWSNERYEPNPGWRVFGGEWRSHLQRASHWMAMPEPPICNTPEANLATPLQRPDKEAR